MAKKDEKSSIKYVGNIIDETKKALTNRDLRLIGKYYDNLKAIKLALGQQGDIEGYDKILDHLKAIQSGNYNVVAEALDLLEQSELRILKKVSKTVKMDSGLVGRTDPSSVKRRILTEMGQQIVNRDYGKRTEIYRR